MNIVNAYGKGLENEEQADSGRANQKLFSGFGQKPAQGRRAQERERTQCGVPCRLFLCYAVQLFQGYQRPVVPLRGRFLPRGGGVRVRTDGFGSRREREAAGGSEGIRGIFRRISGSVRTLFPRTAGRIRRRCRNGA